MATTHNGWPVLTERPAHAFTGPNLTRLQEFATEDVAFVMHYLIYQINRRVRPVKQFDGWREPGFTPGIDNSNHNSATAFDWDWAYGLPWEYRYGVGGAGWSHNLTAAQVAECRQIQRELSAANGLTVVRWGMDFRPATDTTRGYRDPMHWEIARANGYRTSHVTADEVAQAARRIRATIIDTQKAVRTKADLLWGDGTRTRLYAVQRAARHGRIDDARFLQGIVGATVDGKWGPRSAAALTATVKALQDAWGITADGRWGAGTDAAWLHQDSRFHAYRPYGK